MALTLTTLYFYVEVKLSVKTQILRVTLFAILAWLTKNQIQANKG